MEVYFASLGCDKNLVDTEHMLSLLKEEGFSFSEDPETADALVVNTCCFILDAKQESINTILELAEYKKTGRAKALIVTGCLGERYREEIKESLPEVDRVVDIRSQKEIAGILKDALKVKEEAKKPKTGTAGRRVLTTPGLHSSFLKIAEGCDKACTYCIIPKLRGPYKSVPMEDLIAEAEELAAAGVKELNLVAQETGKYGIDLYGEKRLPRLLDRLNEVEGLRWIRLLYCYPEEVDDGLIEAILRNDKVCHYLDMPIQHASDRVLRAMGRKTGKQEIADTVRRLREKIPDICLRTTLIAGFPGETEEDFEELLSFVRETGFDRLGCFPYSREEGTPAYSFRGQVPAAEKKKRAKRVIECAAEISSKKNERRVGTVERVLVEGYLPEEEVYLGRTYRDAPEIDNYVFFESERELMTGELVNVRITGFDDYDVKGELSL